MWSAQAVQQAGRSCWRLLPAPAQHWLETWRRDDGTFPWHDVSVPPSLQPLLSRSFFLLTALLIAVALFVLTSLPAFYHSSSSSTSSSSLTSFYTPPPPSLLCDAPWTLSSPFAQCAFRFVRYRPSTWEKEWTRDITDRQLRVCPLLSADSERRRSVEALHLIHRWTYARQPSPLNLSAFNAVRRLGVLSELHYDWTCPPSPTNPSPAPSTLHAVHFIEPLIGMLRDPFTMCFASPDTSYGHSLSQQMQRPIAPLTPDASIQSKRMVLLGAHAAFLIYTSSPSPPPSDLSVLQLAPHWLNRLRLPLWVYHRAASLPANDRYSAGLAQGDAPRRILFDLGASYYGGWMGQASATATSWFVDGMEGGAPRWDRIIAFEYEVLPPAEVWRQIPMDVLPYYTFINVGVVANVSSPLNPWNALVQMARVEDYVMVKLDIDSPWIEGPLMRQLLDNASVWGRVDEMAYEHHVYVPEMESSWKLGPEHNEWLIHSYQLFRQLRKLGIRMHSWP